MGATPYDKQISVCQLAVFIWIDFTFSFLYIMHLMLNFYIHVHLLLIDAKPWVVVNDKAYRKLHHNHNDINRKRKCASYPTFLAANY